MGDIEMPPEEEEEENPLGVDMPEPEPYALPAGCCLAILLTPDIHAQSAAGREPEVDEAAAEKQAAADEKKKAKEEEKAAKKAAKEEEKAKKAEESASTAPLH